jgi:hypothetical protein
VWRWSTRIRTAAGEELEPFHQSSFNSMFVTSEALRKRAPAYCSRLSARGRAERLILELIDEGRTLQQIAHEVRRRFPEVFCDDDAALGAVAHVSEEYSC